LGRRCNAVGLASSFLFVYLENNEMSTDFRALCAELLDWIERDSQGHVYGTQDLITRARAALAQPEGEGPSDDAWWHELVSEIARVQHVAAGEGQGPRFDLAEAVARWCRPTPPVAPATPAGGLVERVADEVTGQWHQNDREAARAVIREVAYFLGDLGYRAAKADLLEQVAGR
jgi:hypothetical protein